MRSIGIDPREGPMRFGGDEPGEAEVRATNVAAARGQVDPSAVATAGQMAQRGEMPTQAQARRQAARPRGSGFMDEVREGRVRKAMSTLKEGFAKHLPKK